LGVIFFGKTLFVKIDVGAAFLYLSFQVLLLVDGSGLTAYKFDWGHPVDGPNQKNN
jgi:hypothetical protein